MGSSDDLVVANRLDLASSNVSLDYVVLTNGGNTNSPAAAVVASVPITLTHSTISNSSSWGLLKAASDTTDYAATNTFLNNTLGNIGTLP